MDAAFLAKVVALRGALAGLVFGFMRLEKPAGAKP